MLRLYNTNLRDGTAPESVNLGDFDSDLPVYVGRGSQDKPVDVKVALKSREGKEIMSRHHCKLYFSRDRDAWIVEDIKAMNGVFVNHKKIVGEKALKYGDILQLGGAETSPSSKNPNLADISIRFRLEQSDGKGSGKRKRGASQNSADSLTSLNSRRPGIESSDKDKHKSYAPDEEEWKENTKKGSAGINTEDHAELANLRKENKRLKKEVQESSNNASEAKEEVVSLKQKCSSLRKDNKSLRDEKMKLEKADEEKQERFEQVEEELRTTSEELEMYKAELTQTEERLARLEPTGKSCIDDSALSKMVTCPICSLPLLDAVVTACSHGFCRLCLEKKIQEDVVTKGIACECPVCKTNPMGTRTHMYYFRSKHLDDVVDLLTSSSKSAKENFVLREEATRKEMAKLELNLDDRHGSVGVKFGTGSSLLRKGSSAEAPSKRVGALDSEGGGDGHGHGDNGDDDDEVDGVTKRPPRCSYCGVDDHDEKSCPEQM